MGFSIVNHPFWGSPMYGNPHLCRLEDTSYKSQLPDLGDLLELASPPKLLRKQLGPWPLVALVAEQNVTCRDGKTTWTTTTVDTSAKHLKHLTYLKINHSITPTARVVSAQMLQESILFFLQ